MRRLFANGWWVIPHPFQPQDPRYWRAQLMQSLLLILQLYSGAFVVLNVTLFGYYDIAIANFFVFGCILAIQLDLRRNLDLERSAYLLVAVIIFFFTIYLSIAKGRNYSFIWLSVVPLITFFLLGVRKGLYICAPFLTLAIVLIIHYSPGWPSYKINLPSFFNLSAALFTVLAISRHYEKSRTEAFSFLAERNRELQVLAITDPLTQLFNRSHLDVALAQEISRSKRNNDDLAVLILDTDHFKVLNDNYGHLLGDRVLIELSEVLREHMRASDILGRWGGEEFLIIAPHTDAEGALALAEKVRMAIHAHRFTEHHLSLTLSVGIATLLPMMALFR